ncbi:26S proteasome non-ATPase regulatory subunit 9 isoform X1 [Diprion similis]|uniref:26S proteasome non-ATPase regulatory subunit 9 isoform X1 n=2 Tax=Diprion similis TaxID=362088 RepID=UPI001EF9A0A2|nr:26S proteasome non-ATPase regulatory subunit 9 isoform X1 [Diprion similis]
MVVDMEVEQAKERLLELIKAKDKLESDIQGYKQILDCNHVGMNDPLVDSDGFPRDDVDVYQVRHARHKIICLQNDHKTVMRQIETGLHQVHSMSGSQTQQPEPSVNSVEENTLSEPFLKVNLVSSASPAELAGIEVGDLIVEFGSIDSRNFRSLKDVGELVESSKYKPIFVKIKRGLNTVVLTLVPKPWSGKGLLGCNVIPVESVER